MRSQTLINFHTLSCMHSSSSEPLAAASTRVTTPCITHTCRSRIPIVMFMDRSAPVGKQAEVAPPSVPSSFKSTAKRNHRPQTCANQQCMQQHNQPACKVVILTTPLTDTSQLSAGVTTPLTDNNHTNTQPLSTIAVFCSIHTHSMLLLLLLLLWPQQQCIQQLQFLCQKS